MRISTIIRLIPEGTLGGIAKLPYWLDVENDIAWLAFPAGQVGIEIGVALLASRPWGPRPP
jgi:hypothetical protein